MRKITLFTALTALIMLTLQGCTKEQNGLTEATNEVNFTEVKRQIRETYETIKQVQGIDLSDQLDTRNGQFIVVPAGSNNAIPKAIADAGEGGIVYLRAGTHTQSTGITISKRVVLIGENGAVLKIKSTLQRIGANGVDKLDAALQIANAPRTVIQNITIQPVDAIGCCPIYVESSSESAVMSCVITNHQYGVVIEKSDRTTIMGNKITTTDIWKTDPTVTVLGITNVNGKSTYIADNSVADAFFGIWPCDLYGTCERNTTTGNYVGLILCKVPENSFIVPSGQLTGAKLSAGYWKVRDNNSTDNFDAGYLVIDGANNNLLENNQSARNGTYDIELVGDSYRFGFLTPLSYNNTVRALAGQKVKDCGRNNTVIGGTINTSDPCK